ncbi:MipA/OmpV family protein, partial [Pseudomonas syringae pv. tagetis]
EISRPPARSDLLKPALTVLIASSAMTLDGQACAKDIASTESQSMLGDSLNVNFGIGMAVQPRYMGADE